MTALQVLQVLLHRLTCVQRCYTFHLVGMHSYKSTTSHRRGVHSYKSTTSHRRGVHSYKSMTSHRRGQCEQFTRISTVCVTRVGHRARGWPRGRGASLLDRRIEGNWPDPHVWDAWGVLDVNHRRRASPAQVARGVAPHSNADRRQQCGRGSGRGGGREGKRWPIARYGALEGGRCADALWHHVLWGRLNLLGSFL